MKDKACYSKTGQAGVPSVPPKVLQMILVHPQSAQEGVAVFHSAHLHFRPTCYTILASRSHSSASGIAGTFPESDILVLAMQPRHSADNHPYSTTKCKLAEPINNIGLLPLAYVMGNVLWVTLRNYVFVIYHKCPLPSRKHILESFNLRQEMVWWLPTVSKTAEKSKA